MKIRISVFINYLKKIGSFFVELIFPKECIVCAKSGSYLCDICLEKIEISNMQSCFQCGRQNSYGEFCKKCKNSWSLNGILIANNNPQKNLKKIIKTYKYSLLKELSFPLSSILNIVLADKMNNLYQSKENAHTFFSKNQKIIPVPLHQKKLNWRGFNQSELLAKHISQKLELTCYIDGLKRISNTKSQTKLKREKRIINIKNAFQVNNILVKNKNILLIDDIVTSGSTLNECARVLRENGARRIWALVIARNI